MAQHKWHKEGIIIHHYETNQVYLEEGWYTKKDFEDILKTIERQDKHTKEMMGITNE